MTVQDDLCKVLGIDAKVNERYDEPREYVMAKAVARIYADKLMLETLARDCDQAGEAARELKKRLETTQEKLAAAYVVVGQMHCERK